MNRKVKRISAIAVAIALLITGIHIEKGAQKTNAATSGVFVLVKATPKLKTDHFKSAEGTGGTYHEYNYSWEYVYDDNNKIVAVRTITTGGFHNPKNISDFIPSYSGKNISECSYAPETMKPGEKVYFNISSSFSEVSGGTKNAVWQWSSYCKQDGVDQAMGTTKGYPYFCDASTNKNRSLTVTVVPGNYPDHDSAKVYYEVPGNSSSYKNGDQISLYYKGSGATEGSFQIEWRYEYRESGGSSSTATPTASSTPKPTSSPTATVAPTSAPVQTSTPVTTPVPTTEPEVTPAPTTDPGTSTDVRSKPKFKTYWTNHQDVLNIYSTSGTKVKVKPLNKLAKSSSIRWIKNGKTAKICWKRNCRVGKYKFRFTCAGTASWKPGKTGWVITVS